MSRTFDIKPATRERVPLLIGIMGCSGAGKSVSALRLATGIQKITGGDIGAADTESRRLLAYADKWKFKHLDFKAPHGPLDYLSALHALHGDGCKTIIVDSASHEWEGTSGVLEMQSAEVERMAGGDQAKAERVKMAAWIKPKAAHRKFIAGFLQMDCNLIFCFRSREKVKPVRGGQPVDLGWQPIAPDDIVFEMTLNCLLLPGAEGVPTWHPEFQGERAMVKLPMMFREMFSKSPPPQLTEDIGESLARWAAGGVAPATSNAGKEQKAPMQPNGQVDDLIAAYDSCVSDRELERLRQDVKDVWPVLSQADKDRMTKSANQAKARLAEGARA